MLEVKNLDTPDDKRGFEHGDLHLVNLPGATIGRAVFNPGWRWSTDVKPIAGTDSCQVAHTSVIISGRFHVRMDDGTEIELGPGDAHVVSPGHDAWVVGDEPCVSIDFKGVGEFGHPARTVATTKVVACPCGVEFRASEDALDHLVEAVQQHAKAAHDLEASREYVLESVTSA